MSKRGNAYKRPVVVDLPPPDVKKPAYQSIRMDARLAVVVRASRKGKWVRWAHFPNRNAAATHTAKVKARSQHIGTLVGTSRFNPTTKRFDLYLQFNPLVVKDRDVDGTIENELGGKAAIDAAEIAEVPAG